MNVELKKIKRTVYVVGFLLIAATVAAVWFFTRSFVTIDVSPRTANVILDGKELKVIAGEVGINTSTGNHQLKIEADNYISENETIILKRGFNAKISVSLAATPRPIQINSTGVFLMKGSDFNDGYYLSASTIFKTKIGVGDNGNLNVIENRPITGAVVNDVKEMIWSPDKQLALLRHSNGITLFDFMKYDFVHQTDTPWGGNDIGSIAWSPDNSKIAYYYTPSTGERSLIFANTTNTEITRVVNFAPEGGPVGAQLGIENPVLRWSPDSQWLTIIPQNKKTADNKIYLFNTYSRMMKTLTDTGNQTGAVFSPDSNHILYSTGDASSSKKLPELYLMNKDGSEKIDLKIRANLDAVTWTKDSKNIVVATTDQNTKTQTVFRFDTEKVMDSGFAITNLGNIQIESIAFSDDGKLLLYEVKNAIYALKVN